MELQAVRCPKCGKPVLRGNFTGITQVRCLNRRCGRRVWIGGDGKQLIVIQIDRPPREME